MSDRFWAVPVGYIRSSLTDIATAPSQGRDTGQVARVEVLPPYLAALEGLQHRERVILVCWMHQARRDLLRLHPKGDRRRPLSGVFATRSPNRPNPLAIYNVRLLAVNKNVLEVAGVDAVDGTPVLDIRPHIPRLDD